MYEYAVKVLRVIDGDTAEVDADLGFNVHQHLIVRLDRVDAYELTDPRGWMARAFTQAALQAAAAIRIRSRKQEKYGRWLAEVLYITALTSTDWHNLNDELVSNGHAVYKSY